METIEYMCVPSFTSMKKHVYSIVARGKMCTILSKFEE